MKQPKCLVCKNPFERFKSTQKVCGLQCAIKEAKRKAEKSQAIILKQSKKETRDALNDLNWSKRSYCEKQLEKVINEISREIDKGCKCISCGTVSGKWNAGHFHSVGSTPQLRYNLLNIWLQCFHCNHHKSANMHGYDKGLIELLGREKWEYLKFDMVKENRLRKTPTSDFPTLVSKCREVLKEAKKSRAGLTGLERWTYRKMLNDVIGIY